MEELLQERVNTLGCVSPAPSINSSLSGQRTMLMPFAHAMSAQRPPDLSALRGGPSSPLLVSPEPPADLLRPPASQYPIQALTEVSHGTERVQKNLQGWVSISGHGKLQDKPGGVSMPTLLSPISVRFIFILDWVQFSKSVGKRVFVIFADLVACTHISQPQARTLDSTILV